MLNERYSRIRTVGGSIIDLVTDDQIECFVFFSVSTHKF
jgi:hypothetical protein